MDLVIRTCDKLLSPKGKVSIQEVREHIEHLGKEYQEVIEALAAYALEPTPKNKAQAARASITS